MAVCRRGFFLERVLSETSKRGFAWRSSYFSSALPTKNPTAGTLPICFFCPLKGQNVSAEPLQCVHPSQWHLLLRSQYDTEVARYAVRAHTITSPSHSTTTPPHRLPLMQPGPKGVSHAARIGGINPRRNCMPLLWVVCTGWCA
jgi:hypothetical protein